MPQSKASPSITSRAGWLRMLRFAEAGKAFAKQCHGCGIAWFLFFSDLNAFGYVAGDSPTFTWTPRSCALDLSFLRLLWPWFESM